MGNQLFVIFAVLDVSFAVNWCLNRGFLHLFSIYTSPIAAITSAHCVSQQQYPDDAQLYIALSPNDSSTSIVNLESCLNHLYYWCCLNGLAVNLDKTDSILLGTRQQAMVRSHIRCAALR